MIILCWLPTLRCLILGLNPWMLAHEDMYFLLDSIGSASAEIQIYTFRKQPRPVHLTQR